MTVASQIAIAQFNIRCYEVGTLRIEVSTTGWRRQSALHIGFLNNDPRWLLELPLNGAINLPFVTAEAHSIALGLAPECQSGPRQVVNVVPDATVTLRLEVTCK